jgi:intracellular sulfur oxidation DsrE/DsrF family protein
MNCNDAARLIDAHADGELDIPTTLAVEEHLEACAACRRSYESLQAVRAALVRHASTPRAPEDLRKRFETTPRRSVPSRLAAFLRSPIVLAAPGLVALVLASWLVLAPASHQPTGELRVVFHISSSESASGALRNLGNHLAAEPGAKVVVVAHNNGVDFLLAGARDETGQTFESAIREYRRRGVEFRVCHNTLSRRGIDDARVIPEVVIVPSGIAEIGRLQRREGYVYLRL